MALEPRLLELADLLRERFGAKLCWLKTADAEFGRRPDPDRRTKVIL